MIYLMEGAKFLAAGALAGAIVIVATFACTGKDS